MSSQLNYYYSLYLDVSYLLCYILYFYIVLLMGLFQKGIALLQVSNFPNIAIQGKPNVNH